MMEPIQDFGATSSVSITILVDNRADLGARSSESVKRFHKEPLLAEHGFAALIDLHDAGVRILWDAGMTRIALLENARCMKVDLTTIDAIAVSHGHGDHTAALTDVLAAIGRQPSPRDWPADVTEAQVDAWLASRSVPLILHPAALYERWEDRKDSRKRGPETPPYGEWEAAGARIIASAGPYRLGPGCWTTGAVPRKSFETAGIPERMLYRKDGAFYPDRVEDDQAIVIHVSGKGLIVLAGCAHAGIVNTIHHAREISGVDTVWAVLGGFHLMRASADEIDRTIAEVKAFEPHLVSPAHCTGFEATCAFARELPASFVPGAVGTTYLF